MHTLVDEPLPFMGTVPPPNRHSGRASGSERPDAESTLDLVIRARTGDQTALDALCARYLPRMLRWVHGRLPASVRHAVDTQDLVQESLVQVVRRLEFFEPRHEGAFQGYVRQALLNRLRDEVRRAERKVIETLDSARPASDPSPLEQAIGSELLERYEAALLRVKPEDREAIVARVEMGMSWSEIAEALGKNSHAAAQMAVRRALLRLAREMSHERE